MAPQPNTRAQPINSQDGERADRPGRDLQAFLGQMGLVAIGAAALGFIAVFAVYALQVAGVLS